MKKELRTKLKLALYVVFIFLLISVLVFEISFSKSKVKKKTVTYTKEGNISYVTYLKNNNHYSSNYLENDYNFVANLIDYFNVDYSYSYVLSEAINYKLNYEVNAILEVYDSDNDTKPIEKKEYKLLDKVSKDGTGQLIKVDIFNQKIMYETYNNVVQNWKQEVLPNATLKVTISANWSGYSKTLDKEIGDTYTNSFIIPISQKTITINNPERITDNGELTSNESLGKGIIIIIGSTVLLLITVLTCFVTFLYRLRALKSRYEIKINKILREFDRAITEVKGNFIKSQDFNYIEVLDFMELMDVHDNLNEPIIYYKNNDNKSVFSVRNSSDIYYWVIKREDYDE